MLSFPIVIALGLAAFLLPIVLFAAAAFLVAFLKIALVLALSQGEEERKENLLAVLALGARPRRK